MIHSFYRIASGDVEAVVNVAGHSGAHVASFVHSMVEKGWAVSKSDAATYRRFAGDAERTRVLEHIRATYKVQREEASVTS